MISSSLYLLLVLKYQAPNTFIYGFNFSKGFCIVFGENGRENVKEIQRFNAWI